MRVEKISHFKELRNCEKIEINGGSPTKESNFFYDLTWAIGCAVRAVWDTLEALDDPSYDSGRDPGWVHRA